MFLVVGLILKALKYLCDLCWYSCDTKVSFYGYIAALLKLCDDHDLWIVLLQLKLQQYEQVIWVKVHIYPELHIRVSQHWERQVYYGELS